MLWILAEISAFNDLTQVVSRSIFKRSRGFSRTQAQFLPAEASTPANKATIILIVWLRP